jgi:hypothetical protein
MPMAGMSTRKSQGSHVKKEERSACARSKKPETKKVMPEDRATKTTRNTAARGVAK